MPRNALLFAFLATSAFAAQVKPYYLEEHCQQLNDLIIDGTIKIQLARKNDTTGGTCKTHLGFQAKENVSLLVSISKFKLTQAEPNGMCLRHFLQIGGLENEQQQQRMCDEMQPNQYNNFLLNIDRKIDKHMYYFRAISFNKSHALELTVSPVAFAGPDGQCPPLTSEKNGTKAFMCENDSLCIPETLRCDNVPNCHDYSDERDCELPTVNLSTSTSTTTTQASAEQPVELAKDVAGRKNSKKPHIIIGVTGGVVILILVAVIAVFMVRRKNQYTGVTTTEVVSPPAAAVTPELNTSQSPAEDSNV